MGLNLLSRFRKQSADDPPPTESWPLFAFGKLPVYKDFISAGLTDDASREFRDWLSNGFSRHWSVRDDCRSTEIPLHAFLLGLPESRKLAAGVLWGSTDQGGLRRFPFALFTILPAGKAAASVLAALDYLPVFESRARAIRRKYDASGSLAEVYQELRGARIEIPVRPLRQIRLRLAESLSRARVGALASALFEEDAATRWAALLSGVDAAARRPASGAAAYRVPLAEGMVPLDQLKLWAVRLLEASAAGTAPTGILYRAGGEAPRGVMFFRDARAEDILLLHPEAIPTDFVEEIPATEPLKSEPSAAPTEAVSPDSEAPPTVEPAPTVDASPPPVEEILLLGAAARPQEGPVAGAEAPSEPPAAPDPSNAPAPGTASAAPSAAAAPAGSPGWDLPLASLLEPG